MWRIKDDEVMIYGRNELPLDQADNGRTMRTERKDFTSMGFVSVRVGVGCCRYAQRNE